MLMAPHLVCGWSRREGPHHVAGPPNELQPMFIEQVVPRLAQLGLLSSREAYVQIRTAGVGESLLETQFQAIFQRYPALSIAYCAHQGQVDCRVSSPDRVYSMVQLQAIAQECAVLLGDNFVCFGHDTLTKVVADQLRAAGRTLAVAESCTRGLLSNNFTDICGASKFFTAALFPIATTRRCCCWIARSVCCHSTGR